MRPENLLRRPARRFAEAVAKRVVTELGPRIDRLDDETRAARVSAIDQLNMTGPAVPEPIPPGQLFTTFHDLVHAQRTVELSRMPKGARVLLSAGCSGGWYFDWLSQEYGTVERHIGIEHYLERPDNLPPNVEWIATSVAHMPEVADDSVDLVFSGQNIEHLFGDDVVGFLSECARVVRPGGHLVMDSPNREVVSLLLWSMNEHTIEFTPAEAVDLVQLAGFDTNSLRGIWLARYPDSRELLPLDPYESQASSMEILRRIQLAGEYPEHSFIWWLEATRSRRSPNIEMLQRRHAEIFAKAWPERANRLTTQIGSVRVEDGARVASARRGTAGYLMLGPSMPLAAAHYEVDFTLRRLSSDAASTAVVAVLDVVADGGDDPVIKTRSVEASELPVGFWTSLRVSFEVPALRWTGQFRVRSEGACDLEVRLSIALDDRGSPVWPSLLLRPA